MRPARGGQESERVTGTLMDASREVGGDTGAHAGTAMLGVEMCDFK